MLLVATCVELKVALIHWTIRHMILSWSARQSEKLSMVNYGHCGLLYLSGARSILLKLSELAKMILILPGVCKSMFLYNHIYYFYMECHSHWGQVSFNTIQSEKPWELGCFNIWPDFNLGFSYCFDCLKKLTGILHGI